MADETAPDALTLTTTTSMTHAGHAANRAAARAMITEYLSRRATHTIARHADALALFARYLAAAGIAAEPMAAFAADVESWASGEAPRTPDALAWEGITWGLVTGFVRWLAQEGHAVGSINTRLSSIKVFARLAMQADALSTDEHAKIRTVSGYTYKEGKRLDARRAQTRKGAKKAAAVPLTPEQVAALKQQPDTPQGRRDSLLMCLLLDHGLRVGEVATLKVENLHLKDGLLTFYRPKVDKEQTHRLTADTLRAAQAYVNAGDMPAAGRLLRGSRKSGALTGAGMSERAITARVELLGKALGVEGLSAHDCRHAWATRAASQGTDPFVLQEAGGWSSLAMPRRYVEAAKIANDRVKL